MAYRDQPLGELALSIPRAVLIHLKYEKKPGGHWIIRDLMGLDLVGLASL